MKESQDLPKGTTMPASDRLFPKPRIKIAMSNISQPTSPNSAPIATPSIVPEFIRLPKTGTRDPLTSSSRSTLNSIILPTKANGFRPPVKSIVLKSHQHAARGVRMIVVSSLLTYLHGLPSDSQPPSSEETAAGAKPPLKHQAQSRLKKGRQAPDTHSSP